MPKTIYNVLLPIDWCTITLDNVLDPDNGADSDGDTLTDWSEANVELLHWQTDGSIILPTIREHLDTEALNRFVLEYGGSIPSSDMNIIIGTHILPAVSHPKNPDGDYDGIKDPDEKWNGIDIRYQNIAPLVTDTLESLYPELIDGVSFNKSSNPVFLDIDGNTLTINLKYKCKDLEIANSKSEFLNLSSFFYYTHKEIFISSIENKWNTQFIGNLYDFYPGMIIDVKVNLVELDSKSDVNCFELDIDTSDKGGLARVSQSTWQANGVKTMILPINKIEGVSYSRIDRFAAPAHELGHILGLSDMYGVNSADRKYWSLQPIVADMYNHTNEEIWYTYNSSFDTFTKMDTPNYEGDIMYRYGKVRPNTIEMVLQAFCGNKMQYFKPEYNSALTKIVNTISTSIKQYSTKNVFFDKYTKKFYIVNINTGEKALLYGVGDGISLQRYLREEYGINAELNHIKLLYGL